MTTIVADACFLITLDDTGNLTLLRRAKQELGWKVIVPDAVYRESTRKDSERLKPLLDYLIKEQVDSVPEHADRLTRRYPMLGKGEVEAMAYVLGQEKDDGIVIVSDDQRAKKAIQEQGLAYMSTLDFLSQMCQASLISREEILVCLPKLRKAMWITDGAIDAFISKL